MNQTRTILKNSAALGLSGIIEKASTVYLSICVARELGAGSLGVYSLVTMYYGLLFLVVELRSTTYLVREIAKDHSQTSKFVVHTAIISYGSRMRKCGGLHGNDFFVEKLLSADHLFLFRHLWRVRSM